MELINIVGVQFRRAGKIYDYLPQQHSVRIGDDVLVDTERGTSVAKVVRIGLLADADAQKQILKPIIRLAQSQDLKPSISLTMDQAAQVARDKIAFYKLNMRIMKAEHQLGGGKVIVYFSAPGRVDFRDLVKDIANHLRTRVELKQVGARDEAKLVGGLGICGREYCCSSFLRDFVPVSIKMAKNQNLALNPSKVSGGCGRLLCCLTYENDAYKDLRSQLPPLGSKVRVTEDGTVGIVHKTDILNQAVLFETADGRRISAKVTALEFIDKKSTTAGDEFDTSEAESWAEDLDVTKLMDDVKTTSQEIKNNKRQDKRPDQRSNQRSEGDRQPRQGNSDFQPNKNKNDRRGPPKK